MLNLDIIQVKSTAVKAVAFQHNTLFIKFTDSPFYAYHGVSENTFNDLLNSQSIGRFISQNIKGKYQQERLDN